MGAGKEAKVNIKRQSIHTVYKVSISPVCLSLRSSSYCLKTNVQVDSQPIQWNHSVVDTVWNLARYPVWRGAPNSEVNLYTVLCGWDSRQCPHYRGASYLECPLQRGSTVLPKSHNITTWQESCRSTETLMLLCCY